MDIEEIVVGIGYRVDAPNTSSRELWTITKVDLEKSIVEAKSKKTTFARTFAPDQIQEIHSKMADEIISETGETTGILSDGTPINVELITYLPFHERRGRKPQS